MSKQAMYSLCITLLLISSTLNAEDEYPYRINGPIDAVYLDSMILIIEDETYRMVPYAKIHANSKYPGVYTVENLAPKMNVGIKLEPAGNKSEVITELWLLD